MRIPALTALLKQLAASPRPVRSFVKTKDGIRVEFEPVGAAQASTKSAAENPVAFIPGTSIPDDSTPLHPFDLAMNPPIIGEGPQ